MRLGPTVTTVKTGNVPARSSRQVASWVAAFTFLAGSAVLPARESPDFASNAVRGFFSHAEQPLRQYRAYRRMHVSSEHAGQDAWLEAWTELKDGRFSYQVVSERGSQTVRSKVLYPILMREQELVSSGGGDRADLTRDNYEFTEAGRDADGSHLLQIKARRHDVLLVDGRAVLSEGGDLLRVEGRLSKNPSFWTSLVNIVRHYARIGGVQVPVATETTARVRFVGNAQLDVLYDYETVNGRAISLTERRSAAPAHSAAR